MNSEDARMTLQKFLLRKRAKMELLVVDHSSSSSSTTDARNLNNNCEGLSRMSPLQLELPALPADGQRPLTRHQSLLDEWSDEDSDNEPRKLFTMYDIKDDETSKKALEARRRLRYTNIHTLIVPEEKLFLITACDHFYSAYEELIEYIVAIGELRNKQIIVEHSNYKVFMHTLKMFYYTDKGWRFHIDLDEFFSGFLRKFRQPILQKMREAYAKAKSSKEKKVVEINCRT